MCPRGSDVEGPNLGALIGVPQIDSGGTEHVQIVVGVGRLKPRARVLEIGVQRIRLIQLVIRVIKSIFLVALVVNRSELWRVEKTPALQAADGDEIPPRLAPVSQIEGRVAGTEASVGGRHTSCGFVHAESRSRRYFDHQAGFVAKLRRRGAGNHLQRLNGIRGNLVREYLAGLVRDGLSVD